MIRSLLLRLRLRMLITEILSEKDLAELVRSFNDKYGNNYWSTTQNALRSLSASYKNWYDLGYSQGINVRRKIADEAIEKYMLIEIRKNPKISLKKFAEKYGYLKEEEESK